MRFILICFLLFNCLSGCQPEVDLSKRKIPSITRQTNENHEFQKASLSSSKTSVIITPPSEPVGFDGDKQFPANFRQPVTLNKQKEEQLLRENFFRVKSMSSRSMAIRLTLKNKSSALFKPLLRGNNSARLEVAFYRLATLLEVEGVPVSVMRGFYPSRIINVLEKDAPRAAEAFVASAERDERGMVWGAMIEWLSDLEPLGEENSRGKMDAEALFTLPKYQSLRCSLSDMVVLDYLLGNWDRFSGGNIFKQKNRDALALIDHNAAFYNLSPKQREKITLYLGYATCFRRTLIEKIRNLSKEMIVLAVTPATWKSRLLRDEEIEDIMERADQLLRYVDQLVLHKKEMKVFTCN